MGPAVRSASPLSPAAARQGSASDGESSMWAAVLLGVLTAIFAWLWFSRSGDDEDRTDTPKRQLQPVREEEEGEGSAEQEPLTQETPRDGEKSKEPRTPPAADPLHGREEPSTPPQAQETPREGQHSRPQQPRTPGSPEGVTAREHGAPLAQHAKQGGGEGEAQEPGTLLTPNLGGDGRKLQEDAADPTLQSRQESECNRLLHIGPSSSESLRENERVNPQEPMAASTPEDPKISYEDRVQEPITPLHLVPQQVHEGTERTKAPPTLVGEHILQVPEALSTLESEVIKLLESNVSLTLQSHQDSESKSLERRASPTLMCKQGEAGIPVVGTAPLTGDPKPSQEVKSLETKLLPVLESHQGSEEWKAQEAATPLNFVFKQEHEAFKLQEPQFPQTLEPRFAVDCKLQDSSALLPSPSTSKQASEECALQESRVPQSLEFNEGSPEGILKEPKAIQTQASKDGCQNCILQEPRTCDTVFTFLKEVKSMIQKSEAPLAPQSSEEWQDGTLRKPKVTLTLQSYESRDCILQESDESQDRLQQEFQPPYSLESNEESQHDLTAIVPITPVSNKSQDIVQEPEAPLTPQSNEDSQHDVLQEPEALLAPLTEDSQHDIIWEPEAPLTSRSNEASQHDVLQEPEALLASRSNEDSQHGILQEPEEPLTSRANEDSQHNILREPEVPLTSRANESQHKILRKPAMPLTQSIEQSQHGIPQESRDLASQQDNQENMLQGVSFPVSLESKQESQERTILEAQGHLKLDPKKKRKVSKLLASKASAGFVSQHDKDPQEYIATLIVSKQKNEELEQDPRSPSGSESQQNGEDCKLQDSRASLPSTLVSKEESKDATLQEPRCLLTIEIIKTSEDCKSQEPIDPLTLESKQENQENTLPEIITALFPESKQENEDRSLQEHTTQIALVSQQEGDGINLQESKAFLTPESQQNYEAGKAQEQTASLSLSMQVKEIKSQEPKSCPTMGSQHDGGTSELKEAPLSSSLISKQENEECILQVPKAPLAFDPNEDNKLQELSTAASRLESPQVEKANGHPEDRAPQTMAKEGSHIALLLKEEQYNEWEIHPREVPAECSVTGDVLHQVKEEHKPDSAEDESPDEKQGCESDTQFQNDRPETKKALWLSSAPEKLGLNLNEFGEEAKGDAMVDVCLNGHERLMDQCVALVDADSGGHIHGQEERPTETSGELTNIQVLEIDANNSKDIKDMDPKASPMLSQSNEDVSDIRSPNINYESSGAELERLSEADLKPSEGDQERVKKVVAVQPMQQFVNVGFKVHYVAHMDSQQIAVIGDHEKLGGWEDYILLTPNKDGFWTHSVSLPADTTTEWKFVMVENGKIKRWEECANRFLKTSHDDSYAHQWWGYP